MSTMDESVEREKFSGGTDGISFEKLDELILSWGRACFGDAYATKLWRNELLDLQNVDLTDDLQKTLCMKCTVLKFTMSCVMTQPDMLMAFSKQPDFGQYSGK